MIQKTKSEIIEETVAYYSEDVTRRAISEGSCMYYVPGSGKVCAVGKCMIEPHLVDGTGMNASQLFEYHTQDVLKPEYRGHDDDFWEDLQRLHDFDQNWTQTGLSEHGEVFLKYIKETYQDDEN